MRKRYNRKTDNRLDWIFSFVKYYMANKHTKNIHRSEWPSLKSLQITNAGEAVEKREPSYTVGGNVSWCSHCGEQYGGSSEN